jgi:PAS domain S-box-containing protein
MRPQKPESELPIGDRIYQLLVESVIDYAIYMLTPEGIVASWNAGAQRLQGYTADEIVGQHFSRFYTNEDRDAGLPGHALETAARVGKFEAEGWRIRKDGTRLLAHVIIDAIRNDAGDIVGFAKITRDITERKEAERALMAAREALFQSQKMDAIGQLTGGIAHDFNNLLMAVVGSIELVRKRLPEDPRITPLLDNALQGARRGTSLTQRMLAFARRQHLKTETVDIPKLVHDMTDLLQRSLGPRMTIETRFPLLLPPARGDTNQIELALLNLVINARDAMPDGGQIIIAANKAEPDANDFATLSESDYVCISVTDTGEGMDDETLAHAMEPFFTTKGIGKGTGLGLAMVHGMAEQSGGKLVLKSQLNQGTTATIWLPVATEMPCAAMKPVLESGAMNSRPLTILAVDDDGLVLMNTAAMLEELGHEVFEANSGKDALDILRSHPDIDLVITDQAMPRMTGVQLAEIIQSEFPGLPIILATGYAELPAGAEGRHLSKLAKPFREQDLAVAICDAGILEKAGT